MHSEADCQDGRRANVNVMIGGVSVDKFQVTEEFQRASSKDFTLNATSLKALKDFPMKAWKGFPLNA